MAILKDYFDPNHVKERKIVAHICNGVTEYNMELKLNLSAKLEKTNVVPYIKPHSNSDCIIISNAKSTTKTVYCNSSKSKNTTHIRCQKGSILYVAKSHCFARTREDLQTVPTEVATLFNANKTDSEKGIHCYWQNNIRLDRCNFTYYCIPPTQKPKRFRYITVINSANNDTKLCIAYTFTDMKVLCTKSEVKYAKSMEAAWGLIYHVYNITGNENESKVICPNSQQMTLNTNNEKKDRFNTLDSKTTDNYLHNDSESNNCFGHNKWNNIPNSLAVMLTVVITIPLNILVFCLFVIESKIR